MLGHYNPTFQLPLRKLLNRMSEPPEYRPAEGSPQQVCFSSRSRREHVHEVSPLSRRKN